MGQVDPGSMTLIETVEDARVFQPAFLADIQTNPDNAVVQAARKNDLLGWNPRSRTLLCGGAGDPTVPGALHMGAARADFWNEEDAAHAT